MPKRKRDPVTALQAKHKKLKLRPARAKRKKTARDWLIDCLLVGSLADLCLEYQAEDDRPCVRAAEKQCVACRLRTSPLQSFVHKPALSGDWYGCDWVYQSTREPAFYYCSADPFCYR